MIACGAYPDSIESADFLALMRSRETFPFLKELLDAEILTTDGRNDIKTLLAMTRPDGVVPVVFRKPNGILYVTAFARTKGNKAVKAERLYMENVAIDLVFFGDGNTS